MPLTSVKDRARERFSEVSLYVNYLSSLESTDPREPVSQELKIMKGLFYVHLYSAFEKSINDAVEAVLVMISARCVKVNHFSAPMLSIALSSQVKGLKDTGYSNLINKSVDVFVTAASASVMKINETALSGSLQNVWMKTIDEVMKALGIPPESFEPRERATVDEVVDRRNAVAHGRDNAASVGERQRVPVLRSKMEIVIGVCNRFVDIVELHYQENKYLKPGARKHYT